jgi:hypothetical protein
VQTEIQITNWRLSRLSFLPSRTIAEPSSPSRVRCAAPNPRRAIDCSGRLCKISPLGRKVDLRKAKNKDKIRIYLTSTGILMEGDCAHRQLADFRSRVKTRNQDISPTDWTVGA